MRARSLGLWATALVVWALADLARAAEPTEPEAVSYFNDIRPIFQNHCQGCHQPAKRGGGLLMTSFAEIQQGGDSESPGFVPGKPDESLVYQSIVAQGGQPPEMPKDADPLSALQLDLIRRWIAAGCVDDTPASSTSTIDADHPPEYTAPPVITALAYSPDGKLLAVSGYHEVLLHALDGSQPPRRLVGMSERIESARFSPDGQRLAVTGGSPGRFGELQVWDVAGGELLLSVSTTYDTVYGASWSGDGTRVALGCGDNTVRAFDVASGKQVLYQGAHTDWVLDTVWSSDDTHLVSVSRDMTMKLTEVATERFVDNITSITPGALKGGLIAVARRPGTDELLSGGADGEPKLYKMYRTQDRRIGDDFNLIRKYEALRGRIFACDFSTDGQRFAVGSSHDGTGEVRVYETETGKLISKTTGLEPVYAVSFHPDGSEVAAAGFDGTVRRIDPADGTLKSEFVPVPLSAAPVAAAGN